jgi:DNA-binding NarL/FixJ family response regulator
MLIVDDHAVVRKSLRAAFERDHRFRVCGEAADGQEAINQAIKQKPDLIVMDFAMPVMNGLDAARVLSKTMPAIPLVLFTLYGSDRFIQQQAAAAGFRATLSKSDGFDALIAAVRKLLAMTDQGEVTE